MRRVTLMMLGASFLVMSPAGDGQALDDRQSPTASQQLPRIASVRAQLFYRDRGSFSHDVLSDSTFHFWNAIIGEGSAEGEVSGVLITTEVTAARGASLAADTLTFVATSRGRTLMQRRVPLRRSHNGRLFEAFLLHDVGCHPVDLSLTLHRNGAGESVMRRIPFRCGE